MVMAKRMLYLARKLLEEAERLLAGLGGEHGNPILIEIVNKDNLEKMFDFLTGVLPDMCMGCQRGNSSSRRS